VFNKKKAWDYLRKNIILRFFENRMFQKFDRSNDLENHLQGQI